MHLSFPPLATFTARNGTVMPIAGCSTLGVVRFGQVIEAIAHRLNLADHGDTWTQAYLRDRELQGLVQEGLQLNGINPDWVSLDEAEALLLTRIDDSGIPQAGWLIELNRPKAQPDVGAAIAASLGEMLAAISSHTGSLSEAIELASEVPAVVLADWLEAKAALQDPKPRGGRKVDRETARADLAKLQLAIDQGRV